MDMEQLAEGGDATHSHGHTHEASQQQGNEALAILMPYISKYGPFVLILLLKILYSHRYGTSEDRLIHLVILSLL